MNCKEYSKLNVDYSGTKELPSHIFGWWWFIYGGGDYTRVHMECQEGDFM